MFWTNRMKALLCALAATGVSLETAMADANWAVTILEDGCGLRGWTSITLLPSGEPAISYYDDVNKDLKYAERDANGIWHTSIVDSIGWVGSFNSMTILPSGQPAISYVDRTNQKLKYAERDVLDPNVWHFVSIEAVSTCDVWMSIAVMPSGEPAISYSSGNCNSERLEYTERTAGWDDANDPNAWHLTVVDASGNVGACCSLSVIGNYPAISYYDWHNKCLKYAWFDGSSWHYTSLECNNVGTYTSLVALPSGQPAISYHDANDSDLKFAWHNGSDFSTGWQTTRVDGATTSVGDFTSMKVLPWADSAISHFSTSDPLFGEASSRDPNDLKGQPVIAYRDETNHQLKFAWHYGTDFAADWHTTIVDTDSSDQGPYCSLVILPSGEPAISYNDWANYNLKFAEHDGFGWSPTIVDPSKGLDSRCSIAVQPCGEPAVSYRNPLSNKLAYAWRDASDGLWRKQVLTIDGGQPTMAFLPSGQPAIAYEWYGLNYTEHDESNPTSWKTAVKIDDWAGSIRLAIHPANHWRLPGQPAISYLYNNDLRYAERDSSGNWKVFRDIDSVGNVGYDTGIVILPSGEPGISYYDSSNQDLKYAERDPNYTQDPNHDPNDPNAWRIQVVDSSGNVGLSTSIAVLGFGPFAGQPAIAYHDHTNERLKFAWRDPGDPNIWHTTMVGTTKYVGDNTSMVILPTGHPGISYDALGGTTLRYAWHEGTDPNTGWYTTIVNSDGSSNTTRAAVLGSGHVGILYYDNTYWDFRYAEAGGYCPMILEVLHNKWGTIKINPTGIPSPFDPNQVCYPFGTNVTLTATPISGKAFDLWTIYDPNYPSDPNYATTDANTSTTIVMNGNMKVEAAFKCGSSADPLWPLMIVGLLGLLTLWRRR